MSLAVRFALFTSFLSLFVIGGITYLSYRISYGQLESAIGQRLEAIVRTGALSLDGTLHDTIQSMNDAQSPAFLALREQLRRLKAANHLDTDVYTMRRRGEQLEFVVMTNEKPFIGDTYSIREEMLPTLNRGESAYTRVYRDTHGMWISAYAPILDQNGQFSGLLEADIRVETFLALLAERFWVLLWKAVGFALFAVAMSFVLARRVTRKLVYLTSVTEKISLGKLNQPISVPGRDEVAKLANSLERMRESLRLASEMIH